MKKVVGAFLLLGLVIGIGIFLRQSNIQKTISSLLPAVSPATKNTNSQNTAENTQSPITCSGKPLPALTEGPYYKDGSPQKTTIRDEKTKGVPFELSGFVLDTNCRPVANAWIDFWQADANGNYDNDGFTLRGYQYTNAEGRYHLETIIPGEYTNRTPHIHAMVRPRENGPALITQLFFPGVKSNQTDAIFSDELLMRVTDSQNGKTGTFNFIINTDL